MSGMFGPKLALARAAGALSRRSGRGGGTTLPGACCCAWRRMRSRGSARSSQAVP